MGQISLKMIDFWALDKKSNGFAKVFLVFKPPDMKKKRYFQQSLYQIDTQYEPLTLFSPSVFLPWFLVILVAVLAPSGPQRYPDFAYPYLLCSKCHLPLTPSSHFYFGPTSRVLRYQCWHFSQIQSYSTPLSS